MAHPNLKDIDLWGMFEDHFKVGFPGAKCAKVSVSFITADNELAEIGITREGFVEKLAEFEDEDREFDCND